MFFDPDSESDTFVSFFCIKFVASLHRSHFGYYKIYEAVSGEDCYQLSQKLLVIYVDHISV
ncbi:unnamed protein product [Brassica oleracea]